MHINQECLIFTGIITCLIAAVVVVVWYMLMHKTPGSPLLLEYGAEYLTCLQSLVKQDESRANAGHIGFGERFVIDITCIGGARGSFGFDESQLLSHFVDPFHCYHLLNFAVRSRSSSTPLTHSACSSQSTSTQHTPNEVLFGADRCSEAQVLLSVDGSSPSSSLVVYDKRVGDDWQGCPAARYEGIARCFPKTKGCL